MHPSNTWFICVTVVAVVACLSYWTAQANIEEYKQRAFMMDACVKAGGQWKRDGWSAYYICIRP